MADWDALAQGLINTGGYMIKDSFEARAETRKAETLQTMWERQNEITNTQKVEAATVLDTRTTKAAELLDTRRMAELTTKEEGLDRRSENEIAGRETVANIKRRVAGLKLSPGDKAVLDSMQNEMELWQKDCIDNGNATSCTKADALLKRMLKLTGGSTAPPPAIEAPPAKVAPPPPPPPGSAADPTRIYTPIDVKAGEEAYAKINKMDPESKSAKALKLQLDDQKIQDELDWYAEVYDRPTSHVSSISVGQAPGNLKKLRKMRKAVTHKIGTTQRIQLDALIEKLETIIEGTTESLYGGLLEK